ncbi:hypothetical protein BST20_27855 [Mycobacterium branderi]|uniref:Uncharacterized protein n=1 Tax=Mycobacterium branderi TaxID=43348 RepID=A0AA91LRK6_9MYCO|nr:hypothetical protein BST20_27855 [Mycobacterium branderi]
MVSSVVGADPHRQVGPVEQDGRQVETGHLLHRIMRISRMPVGAGLVNLLAAEVYPAGVGVQMGEPVARPGTKNDLVGV